MRSADFHCESVVRIVSTNAGEEQPDQICRDINLRDEVLKPLIAAEYDFEFFPGHCFGSKNNNCWLFEPRLPQKKNGRRSIASPAVSQIHRRVQTAFRFVAFEPRASGWMSNETRWPS
jgi:hypothetical protein